MNTVNKALTLLLGIVIIVIGTVVANTLAPDTITDTYFYTICSAVIIIGYFILRYKNPIGNSLSCGEKAYRNTSYTSFLLDMYVVAFGIALVFGLAVQ